MIMNKREIRFCKHHGFTEFSLQSNNKYVCAKCVIERVTNAKKRQKQKLVDYKGGKCEICGYNKCIEALDFHHLNPNEKDFGLSKKYISFKKAKKEVDKCILVCANCHREIHAKLNSEKENTKITVTNEEYLNNKKPNIRKINIDIENVLDLKKEGKTLNEISNILNISVSTLKRRLKEYN